MTIAVVIWGASLLITTQPSALKASSIGGYVVKTTFVFLRRLEVATDCFQRKRSGLQMREMPRLRAAGYFKNKEASVTISRAAARPPRLGEPLSRRPLLHGYFISCLPLLNKTSSPH